MKDIKQWAIMISAVSIISGVLISILPKSSHKNLFKTITGILLLYSAITPILGAGGIDFNIKEYLDDNYAVSEALSTLRQMNATILGTVLNDVNVVKNAKRYGRYGYGNEEADFDAPVIPEVTEAETEAEPSAEMSFGPDTEDTEG